MPKSRNTVSKSGGVSGSIEGLNHKVQVLETFLEYVKGTHPDVYQSFFADRKAAPPTSYNWGRRRRDD